MGQLFRQGSCCGSPGGFRLLCHVPLAGQEEYLWSRNPSGNEARGRQGSRDQETAAGLLRPRVFVLLKANCESKMKRVMGRRAARLPFPSFLFFLPASGSYLGASPS